MLTDSLPPMVEGPVKGKMTLSLGKLVMADKSHPNGVRVLFQFWGRVGNPLVLKLPGKSGNVDEVIFALKADYHTMLQYLGDMSSLTLDVIDVILGAMQVRRH